MASVDRSSRDLLIGDDLAAAIAELRWLNGVESEPTLDVAEVVAVRA